MSKFADPVTLDNLDGQLENANYGKKDANYGKGGKKISVFKPQDQRKCTDILMVALFGVFWLGMFIIGIYAFNKSNLDSLFYKRDYMGNFCKGETKLLYPIQTVAATAAMPGAGKNKEPTVAGICVKNCPAACPLLGCVVDPYNTYGVFGKVKVLFSTTDTAGVCLPDSKTMKSLANMNGYAASLLGYSQTFKRAAEDIYEGGAAIFVMGGIVTSIVAILWLFILSRFTAPIVWGSIFAFFAVFIAGAYTFGCNGYNWSGCSSSTELPTGDNSVSEVFVSDKDLKTGYKVVFWLFAIGATLVALMTCCLYKQIRLAIAILSEVSKALSQMFALVLFPVIPFCMLMVFFMWWCSVSVALVSMEPDKANVTQVGRDGSEHEIVVYGTTTSQSNLWWYHFFGMLWTTQVIESISIMSIAGSFCAWYWRDDKTELGHTPVLQSFWRTIRYHLGTCIFGALIIALIQLARAALSYLQEKLRDQDNPAVKMVLCILQCFFACLESCMKYIGKNAYIITAMKGTSFCSSAFKGLKLLFANAGRVVALNTAAAFVVAVSKLMIMTATSLLAYAWLNTNGDIHNPLAPTMVTAVLAFCVTHVIMGMYDMGVDTLLMCVLEDEAANKATGNYYAPPSITKLLPAAKK